MTTCVDLNAVERGSLITINDLSLNLENETALRTFKMLSKNGIKGMNANGIDLNNAMNALSKDYFYIISCTSEKIKDKKIIIKIPMMATSEFENKYSDCNNVLRVDTILDII